MRTYKNFDLFSQLLLLLAVVIGYIIQDDAITSISLIAFAILQITSQVIHLIHGKQPWKESLLRKIHLIGVAVVLVIMIYGLVKPPEDKYDMSGLGIIIYALIPAGLVSLFYTVITFLEWRKIKLT